MHREDRKKGTIRFAIKPADNAKQAMLAGDFSNWQPVRMNRREDGTFVCDAPVPTETFEYKFLVDGEWTTDPDHGSWTLSPIGTLNSLGFRGGMESAAGFTRTANKK